MEPDLPQKWFNKLSDKSTCTSCNRCETEMSDKGLRCLLSVFGDLANESFFMHAKMINTAEETLAIK
jgi:hypothetical protein